MIIELTWNRESRRIQGTPSTGANKVGGYQDDRYANNTKIETQFPVLQDIFPPAPDDGVVKRKLMPDIIMNIVITRCM